MITIDHLNLTNIAAASSLTDINTKHIYEAINYVLQKENLRFKDKFEKWSRVNSMNDDELNLILWEYSAFLNTNNLDEKKLFVKKALLSKRNKGTAKNLKDVCKILYDGFEILEWFEYKGKPGTFRIFTDKKINNVVEYKKLIETVNTNKNVRSHLDYVELKQTNMNNYFIAGYKEISIYSLKEKRKKDFNIGHNYFIAGYKEIIGGISK